MVYYNLSLFKRIKNIIRSNSGRSSFESFGHIDSDFHEKPEGDFQRSVEPEKPENKLEQEYYANLELPYGSGFKEIKSAYKSLLKKYHPDRFYGDEKKLALAQEVVKKLNMAYNYFEEKYNKN